MQNKAVRSQDLGSPDCGSVFFLIIIIILIIIIFLIQIFLPSLSVLVVLYNLKFGTPWQSVRSGCLRSAGWGRDVSALFS